MKPLGQVGVALGLMAVSGAVGFWVGRGYPRSTAKVAVTGNAVLAGAKRAHLSPEGAAQPAQRSEYVGAAASGGSTSGQSAYANGTVSGGSSPSLPQLNYLASAQREKLATIHVPITVNERESKLSSAFVKLFAVTEPERQTLQTALEQARRDVDQMANNSVTVKQEGDSLTFVMRPFDGGADVYDRLMDVFAQTLGPERNAAFVALQSDQLSRSFNGFGAEERTLTLTRDLTTNGTTYSVRDDRHSPQMRSVGTWTMSNPESLTERYPMIAPYLDKIAQLPIKPKQGGGK